MIGRQTVYLTEQDPLAMLAREGGPQREGYLRELDSDTTCREQGFISDRSFFSMFTSARVRALDASAYENAELVHDLCHELPEHMHGVADFIFNGSCLDNLFDPAHAMRFLSKMLRLGSRIIDIEAGVSKSGSFLTFSPEWLFDFFAANNYFDCHTLVCTYPQSLLKPWRVHKWHPFFKVNGQLLRCYSTVDDVDFVTNTLAEKGTQSRDNEMPIQSGYGLLYDQSGNHHHIERYETYLRSKRTFGFGDGFEQGPRPHWTERLQNALWSFGLGIYRGRRFRYHIGPPRPKALPTHNQTALAYAGTLAA